MDIRYRYPKKNKAKKSVADLPFVLPNANAAYPAVRELPPVEAVPILYPWKKAGREIAKPAKNNFCPDDHLPAIETILKELNSLIGLGKVKKLVKEIQAFVAIQNKRAVEELATEPLVLHMIFKGNPGTGKTTVARLVGRLFKELGVLPKGHMVEVERADLVGEYIGHTAQKTKEQVKKALGGILFIDEAYSLGRGGERDFGKESIDALVKAMEDNKEKLILILAGYREEMERFMQSNPGVRSRFPIQIDFPDYTVLELMQIAECMLKQRQYCFSSEARQELQRSLEKQVREGMGHNGNARLVRNLIERGIRRQAVRLISQKEISREDLVLIRQQDLIK